MAFLDDKLARAGRKQAVSLEVDSLESLGNKIFKLFDDQYVGNELERTGKLYTFLD